MRLVILVIAVAWAAEAHAEEPAMNLRSAVSFYASFDQAVRGDFGGGGLLPATRQDNPQVKGAFLFREGIDAQVFRIAPGKGIRGGALEALDVLPNRGRIFFPGKGNLPYRAGGWGGSLSVWINTDPNTLLKTPFCDPIQITEKGANNGGLWFDFPDVKPRDLRLGAFPGVPDGVKPIAESDPQAPLVVVKDIGFRAGQWHHLAMTWENFDSGKPDGTATLYIDGVRRGQLAPRDLPMRWNLDRTGIYFAVSYIGLLDELAIFQRPLTAAEIKHVYEHPGEFAQKP